MADPTGPGAELSDETRELLEQELATAREQRHRLAVQLGGEDAEDADVGDRGDDAVQLEGLDDLARMDGRIADIERQLAGFVQPDAAPGVPDGTEVTLRFPGDDVATLRIVAVPAEDQDDVATVDSPLGRALVGATAGDTITYEGPDGELRAEVVTVTPP